MEGWSGFSSVFERAPANTQQIMHPSLYRANKVPAPLKAELPDGIPGKLWNKLEENSMGEFGWKEILGQFIDEDRAKTAAAGWDGDNYICFEQQETKRLILATRERFNSEDMASRFFAAYAEALGKRYPEPGDVKRGQHYLSFVAQDGGVFLRCVAKECVSMQGADASAFAQWQKNLGWRAVSPVAPVDEQKLATDVQQTK